MTHKVHIEPQGIDIEVGHGTSLKDAISLYGIDFPCGGKGLCGNCHIELLKGELELTELQRKVLKRKGLPEEGWRLACQCKVTDDISVRIPEREQVILTDNERVEYDIQETGYAIAVDLGSTTIVTQLIDRTDGSVKASESEINAQNSYGADIISRIAYAMQGRECAEKMRDIVREQIGSMISTIIDISGINDICKVVIVGNSVMHHLFCDYDVTPLSAYPFQSNRNNAVEFTPQQLGWNLPGRCRIVFMPNISHFVGSDILAGIVRFKLHKKGKWTALIDLGTNGEIVIGNKNRLLCASTAAGPAFEGVNIINGMRAVTGAICHIDENTGKAEVIGNTRACGICGSGLIDAIHYGIKTSAITPDGQFADENTEKLPLKDGVSLYNKDVREFQLAKAAIATGFELLAKQLGIRTQDIDTVYIGGGLGNYVNIKNAVSVGLIKGTDISRIKKAGNSALAGCRELCFDAKEAEIEEILPLMEHYSLEKDPQFQDSYCANLFFC